MESLLIDNYLKRTNCSKCNDLNYKKYIQSLIFPDKSSYSIGDGALSTTLNIKYFNYKNMGSNDTGAIGFVIGIDTISNVAATGHIYLLDGAFNLNGTGTPTVTRDALSIDSTYFQFYFNSDTKYRVTSGSLETNYSHCGRIDAVLAGSLNIDIKPLFYCFSYEHTVPNNISSSFFFSNSANRNSFKELDKPNKIIYIPKTLPIPFKKYNAAEVNDTLITNTFLNSAFALPQFTTLQNNYLKIHFTVHQNIEIITALEPFFPKQNISLNSTIVQEYINNCIINHDLTSNSIMNYQDKFTPIEKCNCQENNDEFYNNFYFVKGLPKILNASDTFIVSRSVTFNIPTNALGNLFIAINPYILWSFNTYARLVSNNCYPFQFANAADLNFLSAATMTINSSLANSNFQSYINPGYILQSRLIKGYLNIQTLDGNLDLNSNGNYFGGFLPYNETFNGNAWKTINTAPNSEIDKYSNIKNLLYFNETQSLEGMNIFIPPDFLNNYKLLPVYADKITQTNGFYSTWLIFGCRSIFKSGGLASTQKVNFTFIYECTRANYSPFSTGMINQEYITEYYSLPEMEKIINSYLKNNHHFCKPFYKNVNSINSIKEIKQDNNTRSRLNKIKDFYSKHN